MKLSYKGFLKIADCENNARKISEIDFEDDDFDLEGFIPVHAETLYEICNRVNPIGPMNDYKAYSVAQSIEYYKAITAKRCKRLLAG